MSEEAQVVSFVYSGGNSPGERRYLLVSKEDSDAIEGFDINRQSYRRFIKDKTSRLEKLPTKIVDTNVLPISVVKTLEKAFNDEGYKVVRQQTNVVAYKPLSELKVSTSFGRIYFTTDKGQVVLDHAMHSLLPKGGTSIKYPTALDLVKAIGELA
jgi:hypothetical protein